MSSAVIDGPAQLQETLRYAFRDRELLVRALTHKSFTNERRDLPSPNNERLEFLGDTVLGFVVGDLIYRNFPNLQEGALSKIKAHLVSAATLSTKARELGLGRYLRMGTGEARSGGAEKLSLLARRIRGDRRGDLPGRRPARRGPVHPAHICPGHCRYRPRGPLVPRLQDGPAGIRTGAGPAAARLPDRRRVRPGPREGLRRRGVLGRRDVRHRKRPLETRGAAEGGEGSPRRNSAAFRISSYGAFASLARKASGPSKPTRRRSVRSFPSASRNTIVGTPRMPNRSESSETSADPVFVRSAL